MYKKSTIHKTTVKAASAVQSIFAINVCVVQQRES